MNKQEEEIFSKGIRLANEAQFEKAHSIYEDLLHHGNDETILQKARYRMEDTIYLIAE